MPGREYYRVENESNRSNNWLNNIIRSKWHGAGHRILDNTESPSISASTTATNLSSLDLQSTTNLLQQKRRMLEENLRTAIPEIEPLQVKEDEKKVDIDSDDEDEKDEEEKGFSFGRCKTQLLAAVAVSWISMIIGYTSAYSSPAELSLETDFHFTEKEITWISSLMPLAALVSGLSGGTLIEHIGRKYTLLITDVLFVIGWAVNYFAQNVWYMYISRVICGSSVGIASLTLPVYLAETIQPEVRGTLGLLPTAFGNIGILVCFLFGTMYEWQGLALVGVILSVPFVLIFIWVIPETPRWYIAKGKEEKCEKALKFLRGENYEKELINLKKYQGENDENFQIKELFTRNNIKLLSIILGLMFFQQFSGINAVIFYTTKIFEESGSTVDKTICTTIVGVVNFISTFIAAALIDRLGRKILLYISNVSMVISLAVLGTYFYLKNSGIDVTPYGLVPLASFVLYVLGFSLGFGPIPWLMMGEILPARIRGTAASISTSFNWMCTFIITKTFLLIIDLVGIHWTFWLFGIIMAIALVFIITVVPETRGQSLEDIEKQLAGIKVRRMSSVANLKPMPSTF